MIVRFPPPYALGLPDQFHAWRPDQEKAVDLILNSPTRFVALTMPTGAGKSLVYMAGAHLSRVQTPVSRAVVLTANKALMDQLGPDYQSLGLMDIRGQAAYPCRALRQDGEWSHLRTAGDQDSDLTCDKGPCHVGLVCSLKEAGCDGYDRLRLAVKAGLVSTNYALWMAQARYAQGLGKADLLVCDEAHAAPDELAGALTISLSKWLCSILDLHPPANCTLPQWRSWAAYHRAKLLRRLESPANEHSVKDLKFRRWCKQAEQTLTQISKMELGNWIEDSTADEYRFEILQPAQFAEDFLWQGAKKVVLCSATLTPKTLHLLGIPDHQVTHWECPSRFPIARRRVWYVPTANVRWPVTPGQIQQLATRMDQILGTRATRKGIGHTVSYKLGQQLYERSSNQARLLLHKPGTSAAHAIERLKVVPQPDCLLSPSIDTGVDLPDDACRFQIIFRLPFPSTQSKIVQARAAQDPDYVPYLMTQRLIQSVGRGMRSSTDWCETFILDDKWAWARNKYKTFMPFWFREALGQSPTLPPPYEP